MRIYIMDSDYELMKKSESLINSYPKNKANCFTTPRQLVDAVGKAAPDIVLIDIDAYGSLSAVKNIQSASQEVKIILMSEDSEKASEYFNLHADGFLAKPIEEEKLKEQLFRVRHPLFARIKYGSERKASI